MSEDIGHRHSLAADGLERLEAVRLLTVAIVVPAGGETRVSTQLLVSCLVNLLSRHVGTVAEIWLRCAKAQRRMPLPMPCASSEFREALIDLGVWTAGGRVPIRLLTESEDKSGDVEIHVGAVAGELQVASHTLVVAGSGWRAWVGRPEFAPSLVENLGNPLGPFLAACLAAGEVFKLSRGMTRGRMLQALALSLWSGETSTSWDVVTDGPPIAGARLPPMHLVGAGAVGQALAYVLGSAGLDEAYVAVIDDDLHDVTSLNRCFLAGAEDVKGQKVEAIQRFAAGGFKIYPFVGDLATYLSDPRNDLDPSLAYQVDNLDFGAVVSCVDRGGSRQQIQSLRPRIILGGSTYDLVARSDVYRGHPGAACLACHNPSEQDGDRIRELRKELGDKSQEALASFLLDKGIDPAAVAEELARPTCGSVGEAVINVLGRRPPAFSVGFVSLAAGLLLASNLFRELVFSGTAPPRNSMITLSFLKGVFGQADLSVDENCEQQCSKRPLHG